MSLRLLSLVSPASVSLCGLLLTLAPCFAEVRIETGQYEGRNQFVIHTNSATYFYDRAGGGFSRLIDRDGNDWIDFHKQPLKKFPQSAAAGYRGIPNLVFGNDNPDAGAGHPGFDRCQSELSGPRSILTTTTSGGWSWRWDFSDDHATLTVLRADPEHRYWFLYEGPVAGRWSPKSHFYGSDLGGPHHDTPTGGDSRFEKWQWVYFGDRDRPGNILLVLHRDRDELLDTLWYLGDSSRGLDSDDGMIVFGFGRGPGTQPLLRDAPQQFRLGILAAEDASDLSLHQQISQTAEDWKNDTQWPANR